MIFAHDTEASLRAAVELANTGRGPHAWGTREDLDSFYERHDYTGARTGDEAERAAVLGLREELRTLLTSSTDRAVALVNEILLEARAVPRLVRHGGQDWHIHAVPDESDWATRIRVETAMAMIDLIRADELSRLAVCADDECTGVVLDLSRNRSRKFCSAACGNRNAVAAYRARKAAG